MVKWLLGVGLLTAGPLTAALLTIGPLEIWVFDECFHGLRVEFEVLGEASFEDACMKEEVESSAVKAQHPALTRYMCDDRFDVVSKAKDFLLILNHPRVVNGVLQTRCVSLKKEERIGITCVFLGTVDLHEARWEHSSLAGVLFGAVVLRGRVLQLPNSIDEEIVIRLGLVIAVCAEYHEKSSR